MDLRIKQKLAAMRLFFYAVLHCFLRRTYFHGSGGGVVKPLALRIRPSAFKDLLKSSGMLLCRMKGMAHRRQ
jgi:hypothetical protein